VIPLINLLTAPTAQSAVTTVIAILVQLGIPANQWRTKGVAYGLMYAICSLYVTVLGSLVTGVLTAPFLPLAVPPWNLILAQYVYGVTPIVATYASGVVTLSQTGGVIRNYAANTFQVGNSSTGATYLVTVPFTLSPGAVVTGLTVQCTTLGSKGSAIAGPGPGSIDTVITPSLGVTVVNPAAVIGLDADTPAVVKQKCLSAIAARSYKGPTGAYNYAVATALNGGNPVNINRWTVLQNPSTGAITVYLAAPGGVPTSGDVAAVQASITAIAQPMGIVATAVACTAVPLSATPQTFTVFMTADGQATPSAIASAIDAGLQGWPISGRSTGAGGYVFAAWLYGVIAETDPAIYDVLGLSDVALTTGQVAIRNSNTTIVVTVGS
jgi:hypothetical protein